MNIVFLETKLNLAWTSMQEILPQLETVWKQAAQKRGDLFSTICVDEVTPRMCFKALLKADLLIVSAFNGKMAGFLKVTRELIGIKTPWAFYLHNQATIGLWPLYEFGIGELLHQRDTFIGTCSGDHDLIEKLYSNARFSLLPFYSQSANSDKALLKSDIRKIVFIGRISEQKNLHSLLVAIKILKDSDEKFELVIYGREDYLGSPNMGLKSSAYLEKLLKLREILGLENEVSFPGFIDRAELKKMMDEEEVILCSPSLHSDENFGMALLMGLACGQRVVTTQWGGHENYEREVSQLVSTCSVYQNGDGPFIDVSELAQCLKQSSMKEGEFEINLSFFQFESVVKKIESFLDELSLTKKGTNDLIKSQLLLSVLKARERHKKVDPQKVFNGYSDSLAQDFFAAYGAKRAHFSDVGDSGDLLPWVEEKSDFLVSDPHKGERILRRDELRRLGYIY